MQASVRSSPDLGLQAATGALVASVHSVAVGLTMGTCVAVEASDGSQTGGCRCAAGGLDHTAVGSALEVWPESGTFIERPGLSASADPGLQ